MKVIKSLEERLREVELRVARIGVVFEMCQEQLEGNVKQLNELRALIKSKGDKRC